MIIEENDVIDYLANCSVDEIVSIIVSATRTFLEDEQIAGGILTHCANFAGYETEEE